MTPTTNLAHDGIEQSITEWALDYGITPGIIMARLERGMSIADAITLPMKVGHRGQRLPIFSRKQAAIRKVSHFPPAPRERRIRKRKDGRAHNAKPIEHGGVSLTIREWSQRTGVPASRIYGRLHLGWDIADAIAPGDARRNRQTPVKPEIEHAVNPRTVESRMRRGWPRDLAMSEPAFARMGCFAHGRPGVSSDFAPLKGTGGGSTLQETLNITFSGKAENA